MALPALDTHRGFRPYAVRPWTSRDRIQTKTAISTLSIPFGAPRWRSVAASGAEKDTVDLCLTAFYAVKFFSIFSFHWGKPLILYGNFELLVRARRAALNEGTAVASCGYDVSFAGRVRLQLTLFVLLERVRFAA